MSTANSISLKAKPGEKVKLADKIFGKTINEQAEVQAVRVYLSNQRKANAKTKSRGEIAKTSAKMFKQKGTGRARHGSYSAPIFVGGGVAFGPTGGQNYKLNIPKNISRLAKLSALAEKAEAKKITVLTDTEKPSGKTKDALLLMTSFNSDKKTTLVVAGEKEKVLIKMFRNLPKITVATPRQLNTFQILRNEQMLITEKALNEIN
jgi:large subunit ribosomal protein L4